MVRRIFSISLICACSTCCGVASSEQLPVWQVGLGGGAINIPDYRGSDETGTYPYPFIMPILRSERLKADEDGIRGLIFDAENATLDISLDGSVPVDSKDNAARTGMPDLDPVVQIGPMLRVKLWENDEDVYQALSLNLPVRAAFSIGSGLESVGFTSYPHLTYRRVVPINERPWRLGVSAGLLWSTEEFNNYYYQVTPGQATDVRPAYDADPGFGGSRLIATFSRAGREAFVSFYAAYDRIDGAVFEDSPLVRQHDGLTLGFVATWFLFNSDRNVEVTAKRW
jgi:outer membrane protein